LWYQKSIKIAQNNFPRVYNKFWDWRLLQKFLFFFYLIVFSLSMQCKVVFNGLRPFAQMFQSPYLYNALVIRESVNQYEDITWKSNILFIDRDSNCKWRFYIGLIIFAGILKNLFLFFRKHQSPYERYNQLSSTSTLKNASTNSV